MWKRFCRSNDWSQVLSVHILQPLRSTKEGMYLKAEPYLTISDYTRIEQTMQDLTEKYRDLEKK